MATSSASPQRFNTAGKSEGHKGCSYPKHSNSASIYCGVSPTVYCPSFKRYELGEMKYGVRIETVPEWRARRGSHCAAPRLAAEFESSSITLITAEWSNSPQPLACIAAKSS